MTDPEILKTEKFGSRDYEIVTRGRCTRCGGRVTNEDTEACRDGGGSLFCSEECFMKYYGYSREEV